MVIPSKREVDQLFAYFDKDGSGTLDYKEFTSILINGETDTMEKKTSQYG